MTFVNPYRGAGRPEGNYFMERVIDVAAAEMGIDRATLYRKAQKYGIDPAKPAPWTV